MIHLAKGVCYRFLAYIGLEHKFLNLERGSKNEKKAYRTRDHNGVSSVTCFGLWVGQ